MPGLFSRIDNLVGRVDIPDLGVHVGEFVTASLVRRGDVLENSRDPEGSFYDLHAVLRFVQKALLEDDDYVKVITVWQKKNPRRRWRLEPRPTEGEPARMVLQGRSLTMARTEIVEDANQA